MYETVDDMGKHEVQPEAVVPPIDRDREPSGSGSLDSTIDPSIKDVDGREVAYLPGRALFALSQVSRDSRRAVKRTALAFAHGEVEGIRLPGTEQAFTLVNGYQPENGAPLSTEKSEDVPSQPLYAVAATRQLFILVRRGREPDAPMIVEDLAPRALWERLAHAG